MLSSSSVAALLPTLLLTRHPASRMIAEPLGAPPLLWEQTPEGELPEELMGPWELKCTLPGAGDMWIELGEDGDCGVSSKLGKGRRWSAEPQRGGGWRVRFVILDKLSRQMRWEGSVRKDEVRGAVMSGKVRGPPKHGASAAQIATGVIVGEFDGYQLQ